MPANSPRKTYVLDTNVLLTDADSLNAFGDNNIIIPLVVLEELDRHKTGMDDTGRNARQVSRELDALRKTNGNLFDGVDLPNGGKLKVSYMKVNSSDEFAEDINMQKVDNVIIAFMLRLKLKNKIDATLVSRDVNIRLKCDALGIKAEDYLKMHVSGNKEQFYHGVAVIDVDEEEINEFYDNDFLTLASPSLKDSAFCPNQVVILKNTNQSQQKKSAITKVVNGTLLPIKQYDNVFGLKPRNKEQHFSLDLLLDTNVKIVTMTGPSGCGKTLLALAAALDQLKGFGTFPTYERLIVTRPIQPVGRDIGFLPGTIEEKMEPWIAPIKDNINFLMGCKKPKQLTKQRNGKNQQKPSMFDEPYLALLQENGVIEIEAITHIRGRSIPNSFIIIDESQNLSIHELKTIVTRVGEGTKIVLTGDTNQIDRVDINLYTNGLTYAIEKFKEYDISGHITLLKGERSELATLASQIL